MHTDTSPSTLPQGWKLNNWSIFKRLAVPLRGGVTISGCRLCGDSCEALGICEACVRDLPGRTYPNQSFPPLKTMVCAFDYAFPVDTLVARAKFNREVGAAALLGALLTLINKELGTVSAVMPIPMPTFRLLARGYNHATEIARPVARNLGVPLTTTCLVRASVHQTPQVGLDRLAREANMKNAFRTRHAVTGHVLLVDDVVTTGATLRAAARCLMRAGTAEVSALVVAHKR